MNKYFRGCVCGVNGFFKVVALKLFHIHGFHSPLLCFCSPFSEITIERGSNCKFGRKFRMRGGSRIRVRKGASLSIGNDISVNHGCMIVCRDNIEIGDYVQFGPNVLIYDHDHDYRAEGGVKAGKFVTSPVKIGNNVWIGANSVILRGTEIGDNCVFGAGSIIKGKYDSDSVIVQKRIDNVRRPN